MPRTYKKKGKHSNYSDEDLQSALKLIREQGKSIYSVSKERNIPKETLRRWMTSPPSKAGEGRRPVLTIEDEEQLVQALTYCASNGFPHDRDDVAEMVKTFLNFTGRKTCFKDGSPGKDWMISFVRRHKEQLGTRKAELLTKARAQSLTPEVVDSFFTLLSEIVNENDLSPNQIYNLDETGLSSDPRSKKVFVPRKSKDAYLMSASCGKAMYSVLFCASAAGTCMLPFVVYKGLHLYGNWTFGGPPGATYGVTPSGWMQDFVFESWFINSFISHIATTPKPVLLIYDGHGSHMTYKTVSKAMESQVIILCLPPNCSHALQPLDVGVFKNLKCEWRKILKEWFRETRLENIDKSVFPTLLNSLWRKMSSTDIINGFRGSGIFPVDKAKTKHRIVVTPQESQNEVAAESNESVSEFRLPTPQLSPRAAMRSAVSTIIAPILSPKSADALNNKKRKRTRVQAQSGEVLTRDEVMCRLLVEQQKRDEKKNKGNNRGRQNKENGKRAKTEENGFADLCDQEMEEEQTCHRCNAVYDVEEEPGWVECELCDNWCCIDCRPSFIVSDLDNYYCQECERYA